MKYSLCRIYSPSCSSAYDLIYRHICAQITAKIHLYCTISFYNLPPAIMQIMSHYVLTVPFQHLYCFSAGYIFIAFTLHAKSALKSFLISADISSFPSTSDGNNLCLILLVSKKEQRVSPRCSLRVELFFLVNSPQLIG